MNLWAVGNEKWNIIHKRSIYIYMGYEQANELYFLREWKRTVYRVIQNFDPPSQTETGTALEKPIVGPNSTTNSTTN